MNDALNLLNSFQDILTKVMAWIDSYIESHHHKSMPVDSMNFKRLGDYFSKELLASSKVVLVDKVVLPPLSQMGLSFFAPFEQTPYSGITYKNTFFLAPNAHARESVWFHELVHVIQWDELKPEIFLITYAIGLLTKGYRNSPLETMAYDFQSLFDEKQTIPDLEQVIRNNTRIIAESPGRLLEQKDFE